MQPVLQAKMSTKDNKWKILLRCVNAFGNRVSYCFLPVLIVIQLRGRLKTFFIF